MKKLIQYRWLEPFIDSGGIVTLTNFKLPISTVRCLFFIKVLHDEKQVNNNKYFEIIYLHNDFKISVKTFPYK